MEPPPYRKPSRAVGNAAILKQQKGKIIYMNLFENLNLSEEILNAINDMNYDEATEIQAGAIPLIYSFVGLKVGAEFTSMLTHLAETEKS